VGGRGERKNASHDGSRKREREREIDREREGYIYIYIYRVCGGGIDITCALPGLKCVRWVRTVEYGANQLLLKPPRLPKQSTVDGEGSGPPPPFKGYSST
jgi:hypothetical protein